MLKDFIKDFTINLLKDKNKLTIYSSISVILLFLLIIFGLFIYSIFFVIGFISGMFVYEKIFLKNEEHEEDLKQEEEN